MLLFEKLYIFVLIMTMAMRVLILTQLIVWLSSQDRL